MIYQSYSSEDTKQFANKLAHRLLSDGLCHKHATVIALSGDLGAGKTTFAQGFYKGLGIKKVPASPTFILMRRTALRGKKFKNVFHVDAYRLKAAADMKALGFKELLQEPSNLFLIEWPERISNILPKKRISASFKHGKTENLRTLKLRG
jgi:tRNA threonylcarbamoyladenosine biosynthesis protein TsaE